MRPADFLSSRKIRILRFSFATAVSLVILFAGGCSGKAPPKMPPAPVEIAAAKEMDVPETISIFGTVEALQSVTLRAQVAGYITRILFSDGDEVKAGQTLFQIDPRPFDAAVQLTQANLERDRAQYDNAERQLARSEELFKGKLISQQEYDLARTAAGALRATVKADEASALKASLDRQYATVRTPITGRAGARLVDLGSLVKINDTTLVVVNQIEPIEVRFAVPEKYLAPIRAAQAKGDPPVKAFPAKNESNPAEGKLVFIDNAVDPATGTVALKAEFSNNDHRLWPGQFVDVTMTLGVRPNAVVVPASAVMTGQKGQFVFVLDAQDAAQMRPVETGDTVGDLILISKGLAAGDRVVVDGQLRVIPGQKVAPPPAGKPAAPAAGEKAP